MCVWILQAGPRRTWLGRAVMVGRAHVLAGFEGADLERQGSFGAAA